MNAIEDETLSKEANKGLVVFLFAELKRHNLDVEHIRKCIDVIREKLELTNEEMVELEKESEKYVRF